MAAILFLSFAIEGADRVTVITHGAEVAGERPGWLDSMADAVAARSSTGATVQRITIAPADPFDIRLLYGTPFDPPTLAATLTTERRSQSTETIIKIFWNDVSGIFLDDVPTGDVAVIVLPLLPPGELHLIGHSRGASVMVALATGLGTRPVSQLTFLDPHPDGAFDAAMKLPANVAFADNYYQTEVWPRGEAVAGAQNTRMHGLTHSGIHDWYLNTIRKATLPYGYQFAVVPALRGHEGLLVPIRSRAGAFEFGFAGIIGRGYTVEMTSDFVTFLQVATGTVQTGFERLSMPAIAAGFFRVKVE